MISNRCPRSGPLGNLKLYALFSSGFWGDTSADASADLSGDVPNWAPMGLHAAQCADLHGDKHILTKPSQMVSSSAAPKEGALVVKCNAEPSAAGRIVGCRCFETRLPSEPCC